MICIRKGGVSLPELIGDELGFLMRLLMRLCSLILLVLVGTVFITTPAALLDNMIPDNGWLWSNWFWVVIILFYFLIATFLPIDKLIGKIYPLFGMALLIMALGIGWNIYTAEGWMPELTDQLFVSHHPKGLPIFPMLCITIACGAISGFHGTQSPLMSRCLTNEKYGRPIFYGSMITEGVVALIWAAATIKFASTLPGEAGATAYEKLASMGNPAIVVNAVSTSWMGTVGAVLAVLGVVAAPITSGDTAFRSARLIAADFLHMDQRKVWSRLVLCLPLFAIATLLMFMDFNVLWRYFAWFNQTLACTTLWAATVWLARKRKFFYICLVPAMFMTVVCTSYIIIAPEGFSLPWLYGVIAGLVLMVCFTGGFFIWKNKNSNQYNLNCRRS
jgi:carbon starvation protein CstA